ncbi:hypothetical protein L9F63_005127 [Diploptera punctata]|uniref:Methyltransferase domain-containing protein n=1 Tax=Diploptera punctata TaxID=6984 RepID=A0AAD8E6R1_DIPPU|nr:hypothetical protein L9F63_005127 [Diploptera punctata]
MSESVLNITTNGLKILEMYSWLLDSYVLDYFTDHHWNKLPSSWRNILETIEPQELEQFLNPKTSFERNKRLWPLSLMCLHVVASRFSGSRNPVKLESIFDIHINAKDKLTGTIKEEQLDNPMFSLESRNQEWQVSRTSYLEHSKLHYIFTKHVKPKKQHEISRMAQITASVAEIEDCQYVVDIGSGLGHLARKLAYGYGLRICCLEAQEELSVQAKKLDLELEISASKVIKEENINIFRPVHLTVTLDSQMTAEMFMNALKTAFGIGDENFRFGIVGLHPCGDLAPILMQLFVQCKNAIFINIVGCCYMKLSTDNFSGFCGYPMSNQRLKIGQYENLKVHCYRAVLEKILVKYWPHLKHTMIKSIKHSSGMTFTEYITLAFTKLGLKVPQNYVDSEEIKTDLLQWKKVVTFYTLRLMLAPLVETVVLLDRLIYLQELDIRSSLIPLFDPILSPRNNILIGRKKS